MYVINTFGMTFFLNDLALNKSRKYVKTFYLILFFIVKYVCTVYMAWN